MCRILSRNNIYKDAEKDVKKDIVEFVAKYIEGLKANNLYHTAVSKVLEYGLTEKKYDAFGKSYEQTDLFTTSDADLDRKVRIADRELGNFGLSNEYGRLYYDEENPNSYLIDTVLFANETAQIDKLKEYAKKKFIELENKYRRPVRAKCSETDKKAYNNIVSGVDLVSPHLWEIPENIKLKVDPEEQKRDDFVTWIRNPAEARSTWALVIPYLKEGTYHGLHPDMVIVRQDEIGYVFDILEPHNPEFKDNLGKSIGFAKYVAESESAALGRVQLILDKR